MDAQPLSKTSWTRNIDVLKTSILTGIADPSLLSELCLQMSLLTRNINTHGAFVIIRLQLPRDTWSSIPSWGGTRQCPALLCQFSSCKNMAICDLFRTIFLFLFILYLGAFMDVFTFQDVSLPGMMLKCFLMFPSTKKLLCALWRNMYIR